MENNDNIMEELLDKVNRMELEIVSLKKQLADAQPVYYPPLQVNDPNLCTDGKPHEYPYPWHSTTPAPCKKCGKLSETYKITFGTDSGTPPWNFNEHGGNVMNNENLTNLNHISDCSGIF